MARDVNNRSIKYTFSLSYSLSGDILSGLILGKIYIDAGLYIGSVVPPTGFPRG